MITGGIDSIKFSKTSSMQGAGNTNKTDNDTLDRGSFTTFFTRKNSMPYKNDDMAPKEDKKAKLTEDIENTIASIKDEFDTAENNDNKSIFDEVFDFTKDIFSKLTDGIVNFLSLDKSRENE